MKEETYRETTRTFGPTLERREFTEDEKVVLLHFFTNIDRNVYAATDAMPSSLWALLEGGYSRSQLSMRMRFLEIFNDMEKDFQKGKIAQDDLITVSDFAKSIKSNRGLNLSFFLGKAEKFMRKWAVQYGHDSLKDSDVVRFAIENITQWATNPIEEARLGAYQEKSTRYVGFSRESLVVPTDLHEFEKEIRAWNTHLMDVYEESRPVVSAFITKQLDPTSFKSEAALKRTVDAKTFDVIRYILPTTILTSLGVVWPTREAERHISQLLSDPREEMQAVGAALLEEGKKISPGLLNHVEMNIYHQQRRKSIQELQKTLDLLPPAYTVGRERDAVRLISLSTHGDARIAAAILFEQSTDGHRYKDCLQLCINNPSLIEKIFSVYFAERGKFDSFPMSSEVGNMLFEATMDFGGYRDVQRHRRNLFLRGACTVDLGFEYPEYVAETPELRKVKKKFDMCVKITEKLHHKIRKKYPHLAEYIIMMAHKQHVVWQMDPRQLAYIVELRTTPAGHYSYRNIGQRLFQAIKPHMPLFCKYIRVDLSTGEEGRKIQEERTVQKLEKLGGDLHKVT